MSWRVLSIVLCDQSRILVTEEVQDLMSFLRWAFALLTTNFWLVLSARSIALAFLALAALPRADPLCVAARFLQDRV